MPTFSGKVQYLNSDGSALQAGPCRVSFEAETLTLTPASGAPLALDFGDIDIFLPGEYELTLTLYTGNKILLHQFGKTFQDLCHDLLEAYRKRLLQCLLLEDLEEITRFESNLPWLAITAAVTPFIGLFGTVWGIIDAFHGLGTAGAATLRAVAPGISEALITTAAGLAAAIPAAIAYNQFTHRIRELGARMDDFSLEFLNMTERGEE